MQTPIVSDQAVTEVMKRLDRLADKLGVTADFIFKVYVKQSIVQGLEDIVMAVAIVCSVVIAGLLAKKTFKRLITQDNYDEWPVWCGALLSIYSAAGFVASVVFTYDAIGELLNPQFWALQNIFQAVK